MEEADQCHTCDVEERDFCVLQEADLYLAGVVDREAAAAANEEMPDVMADMQAGEDPCLVRSQVSWQTCEHLSWLHQHSFCRAASASVTIAACARGSLECCGLVQNNCLRLL